MEEVEIKVGQIWENSCSRKMVVTGFRVGASGTKVVVYFPDFGDTSDRWSESFTDREGDYRLIKDVA